MTKRNDKEEKTTKVECNCGCGCLTLLIEIVAFILICNIFGCEWAEKATDNAIIHVKELCR